MRISFENKNAGTAELFQTRPTLVRIETGSKSFPNLTIVVSISKQKFHVNINDIAEDLTDDAFTADDILVIPARDNFIVVQGKEFQVRLGITGDLYVKLSSAFSQLVSGVNLKKNLILLNDKKNVQHKIILIEFCYKSSNIIFSN